MIPVHEHSLQTPLGVAPIFQRGAQNQDREIAVDASAGAPDRERAGDMHT